VITDPLSQYASPISSLPPLPLELSACLIHDRSITWYSLVATKARPHIS